MHRSLRRWPIAAAVALLALLGTGVASVASTASAAEQDASHPNIVFVLTDDLSWNLVAHMPAVQQMQSQGMTFTNFVVTDSLCCPSRSSIFSGKFPHDTHVFTNDADDGGFATFHNRGEEAHTFATALQQQGYRTGMMGKYLNGYVPSCAPGAPAPFVPPGWDEWDVAGDGYHEYNYCLAENHKTVHHGHDPSTDFLVDVMSRKGNAFVKDAAARNKPFLLELATFAPHGPYVPAKQDENKFPGLTAPRPPAYDNTPSRAPGWLDGRPPLTDAQKNSIDTDYRLRAQAVQSVDRMIKSMRQTLKNAGVANNTYLVFGSDNGYHMGEYRLMPGKQTAFDTDVNVPLVVVGPGVKAGDRNDAATANIDLAPTFQRLGGAPVAADVDGHSLAGLLHGDSGQNWRTVNLIEHHGPNFHADDPDLQASASGIPPTYDAIRTNNYTWVEYANGDREYYDLKNDPQELHNVASDLPPDRREKLRQTVAALKNCHTGDACWNAGR
jgi:N-acetylglucosamine-6-sulfatase